MTPTSAALRTALVCQWSPSPRAREIREHGLCDVLGQPLHRTVGQRGQGLVSRREMLS